MKTGSRYVSLDGGSTNIILKRNTQVEWCNREKYLPCCRKTSKTSNLQETKHEDKVAGPTFVRNAWQIQKCHLKDDET